MVVVIPVRDARETRRTERPDPIELHVMPEVAHDGDHAEDLDGLRHLVEAADLRGAQARPERERIDRDLEIRGLAGAGIELEGQLELLGGRTERDALAGVLHLYDEVAPGGDAHASVGRHPRD